MDLDNLSAITKPSLPPAIPANPCILVIFGVMGDLSKRLLIPAICNLANKGLLDKNFTIVGVARRPYDDASFRKEAQRNIQPFVLDPAAKKQLPKLLQRAFYVEGDFNDQTLYAKLKIKLQHLQKKNHAATNCIFYFATPPGEVANICEGLSQSKLLIEDRKSFRRIAIEKPFGHDVASAKELNKLLLSLVKEEQIYRVDHFSGKETVQNIFAFRFANILFEPIWNSNYIDNIQITVAETLGVESRGNYYEETGAMRDMVPNHLFELVSLLAMEPPKKYSAADVSAEKLKALAAIKKLTPKQVKTQVVRGQYTAGVIDNQKVIGYRVEEDVAAKSTTETFIAMKLILDNQRWKNVPFYLRTGKRMAQHTSEIVVQFKSEHSQLLLQAEKHLPHNCVQILIQPRAGIIVHFRGKIPDPGLPLGQYALQFDYNSYFDMKPLTGYEAILYDCMNGDHVLFKNAKLVDKCWEIVQPILNTWDNETPRNIPTYPAGAWGPKEAKDLLKKDGRRWCL